MKKDLHRMSTEELGRLFPVRIADYDPYWPALVLSEKKKLSRLLGKDHISRIEHIGSTSVPGLCAKPTVDIFLEIPEPTPGKLLVDKLRELDYQYIPKPENPPPHMMFVKGYSETGLTRRGFHIHVRYPGDWDDIVFHDHLRANPEAAAAYAALKIRLAGIHRYDREQYTEGKTGFVRDVLKIIEKERQRIHPDRRL